MKCAIYCRLSKEDTVQGEATKFTLESESIKNQKALLLSHAEEMGWDVYKVYIDEDYSGADRYRPAFRQLLADAEAKHFSVVLCKTQSRFTRDMELVERYIHDLFPRWGIRFVALLDHADTDIRGNKKARQINGLVNEWYLEDLSENIRAVLDNKRRKGEFIGSFSPYGYEKSLTDKNRLVVDKEAAEVVRLIFSLASNGYGKRRIVDILNRMCIPNPTKYKEQKGLAYVNSMAKDDSGMWNRTTVGRILSNEIYTGVMVQGKRRKLSYKHAHVIEVPHSNWIRVEGTHEAIISKEDFAFVQKQISERRREGKKGKPHLLAGKVICSNCESTMRKITNRYKNKLYGYLRCNRCKTSINLEILEDVIRNKISHYLSYCLKHHDTQPFKIDYGGSTIGVVDNVMKQMLDRCKKNIRQCVKALEAIYIDLAMGRITQEQSHDVISSILSKKEDLEMQQRELLEQMKVVSVSYSENKIKNNLITLDASECKEYISNDLMQKAVAALVDIISIERKDPSKGEQKVFIRWSF